MLVPAVPHRRRIRLCCRHAILGILVTLFPAVCTSPAVAQSGTGNDYRIGRLKIVIDEAGDLYKADDFAGSAKKIERARQLLERALTEATEEDLERLETEYRRIAKAHELLTAKGQVMADLPSMSDLMTGPSDGGDGNDDAMDVGDDSGDAEAGGEDSEPVSFVQEIQPILVNRCGSCHVFRSQKGINFGSYEALIAVQNSQGVIPGDPESSLLLQSVERDDMPPNGKPLPKREKALLRAWIEQGASFDGAEKDAIFGNPRAYNNDR